MTFNITYNSTRNRIIWNLDMGNANPRNGQFDSSTWLPPRLFSENIGNGKSCQKIAGGGVVKARKPSEMVE